MAKHKSHPPAGLPHLLKMSPMAQVLQAKPPKLPDVAAPSLEGLAVTVPAPEDLTQEDLLRAVHERSRAVATARERAEGEQVALGDDVQVDILGYVGGKLMPFSARFGAWMELAPQPALPGFAEAVAQGAVGDALEVSVTLPADYPVATLAGKPARFMVDIRAAKELKLPDLETPAGVQALGLGATLDDVMEAIREQCEDALAAELRTEGRERVLAELVSRAKVQVPKKLVEEEISRRWGAAEGKVMVDKNFSVEEQREALQAWLDDPATRADCERRLATGLVLKAVAEQEKLTLDPEKLEALLVKYGADFGLDAAMVHGGLRESKEATARLAELGWYLAAVDLVMGRAKVNYEGA